MATGVMGVRLAFFPFFFLSLLIPTANISSPL
jgi:hypothetical protein